MVSVTEDWAENCEGCSVVEDGAEGNGGWLDGWEIVEGHDGQSVVLIEEVDGRFFEYLD